jgi:membrane protein DedA with SNARE-associated domain
MIEILVSFLESGVLPLGLGGVFAVGLLQEVIIFVPSTLTLLTTGFLFLTDVYGSKHLIDFTQLVVVASFGITIGTLFLYSLAFYLGRPLITKWGRLLGIGWQDVEKIEQKFSQTTKDEVALFFLRAVPFTPNSVVSAFAGLFQVNLKKYLLITFSGTLIRSSILIFIGSQVGHLYREYAEIFNKFENVILLIMVLVLVVYLIMRKRSYVKI